MSSTVLVAGGAGFIGSHVCKALSRSGRTPVVYDNLSSGHRDAVRWGPFEHGDLRDQSCLAAAIDRHHPNAVIHLAGYIAAGESVVHPGKYYNNNIGGALALLRAMRDAGITRIVFSSSAAVYGAPETLPVREDAPIRPVNPYGHTKAMTEQMLRDHATDGLASVSLRYFNAAGADPDGELGERHEPETHLLPLVLEAAAGRRSHIEIFGDNHPTRDGTCIRDYVHVTDLAAAHVRALEWLQAHDGTQAFNLGNGDGYSVHEVIAAAGRVTGRTIPTRISPPRAGDPPELVADASHAMRELRWRQAYAELDVQIAHAWHRCLQTTSAGPTAAERIGALPRSDHAGHDVPACILPEGA